MVFLQKAELTKEGIIKISQNKIFDKLMIKNLKMANKKTNVIKFPASPTKLERQGLYYLQLQNLWI